MRKITKLLTIVIVTSVTSIVLWEQTNFASLFNENFWLFGVAVLFLALIISPLFGFIWYRQRVRFYRMQCEIAQEKNHVQDELKESESKFREIFDDAPVGYHELDSEGRIVAANLIVATQNNYDSIDNAIASIAGHFLPKQDDDLLMNGVEFAMRCFDPCLACATHAAGRMPMEISIRRGGEIVRTLSRRSEQ